MRPSHPPEGPKPSPGTGSPGDAAPAVESAAILQGRQEVVILHNGREYRLRHTRLGKLILTA